MQAGQCDAQRDSRGQRPIAEHRSPSALQPSDTLGGIHLAFVALQTAVAGALSLTDSSVAWLIGQALLALALLQWFVVLHEAGHMSLFRTRALNVAAGHLASVFAFIPYASWRRVHGLHHVWTGWQDKDPTTAALTPRARGKVETALVNFAWRTGLPLFSVIYRVGNYWHLPRLLRLFPTARQRRAIVVNALVLLAFYAGAVMLFGGETVIRCAALALLLGLALQDPLILSQHTHIAQPVSEGRSVAPLSGETQIRYTRSLRFPRWFARWLLMNFNMHERHHLHPNVPGYRLAQLEEAQPNEVHWWTWLRAAKRLSGAQFVFGHREQTGFRW